MLMRGRRPRLPSVRRMAAVVAAALTAVVVGVSLLHLSRIQGLLEARQRGELQHEAWEAANAVAYAVDFYRRLAYSLVGRADVIDYVAFGDVEGARQWAGRLRAMLPDVVGLALFRADGTILGEPASQRVGPACLADLRRLAQGERLPQPRFHDDLPGLAHFDLIVPVVREEERIGLVFLSVAAEGLAPMLRGFVEGERRLRVLTDDGRLLAGLGEIKKEDGRLLRLASAVPGTGWRLELEQRLRPVALPTGALVGTAAAAGMALALVLGLSAWAARRFRGELRAVERMLRDVLDRRFSATDWHPRLEETSRILPAIAELAARLEKERQRLAQESLTDELTALPNRRHFNRELVRALEMAERGALVCVGMIDLDGLKRVNDQLGHEAGDRLLRRFAETLDSQLRRTDFAGRLGGDEFGVILYGTSAESAVRFMDRLRRVWRERVADDPELAEMHATLSCGLAFVPVEEACSRVEILRRADRALYEAKARGRDQVVVDQAAG